MSGPAPSRLRARSLSPTAVSLHWTDASLGRARRIVDNRYYNIHYEATTDDEPGAAAAAAAGRTMSVIVKDLSVVLHDLRPATRYQFKVRTVKDGLTSAFSNVVTAWTPDRGQSPIYVDVVTLAASVAVGVRCKKNPYIHGCFVARFPDSNWTGFV